MVYLDLMDDKDDNFTIEIDWGDALEELLLLKTSEGFSKDTVRNYRTAINKFIDFCIKNKIAKPADVPRKAVRFYLQELIKEGKSRNYVNMTLSRLRNFYDFLVGEDYIHENQDPTKRVKFLRKARPVIIAFNNAEVEQMIKVAGKQKNKFYAERDKLMIMLMADTGVRCNELVSLKNKDITKDSLFIRHGKGDKQRMIYITNIVARQLIKYKRVRKAYFDAKDIYENQMLFRNFRGENMNNDGVQKMLKRHAEKCDIREEVRVSPHTFRHYFAQSQLKNGISIYTLSKLLGHDSLNTTQVYLQGIADDDLINSAIKTSPLMNLK